LGTYTFSLAVVGLEDARPVVQLGIRGPIRGGLVFVEYGQDRSISNRAEPSAEPLSNRIRTGGCGDAETPIAEGGNGCLFKFSNFRRRWELPVF